jgi:hypothetical protein
MEEEQLSEKESLALIASMITKAKNSYIDSGIGPLFWGVLITVCSLVSYSERTFQFSIGFDIWNFSLLALIPQIYFSVRAGKKNKGYTPHDESMMNYVWGTFAILIFMTNFYIIKTHAPHGVALQMMVFGIPTFITGGIRNFKPMIIGGLICMAYSRHYFTQKVFETGACLKNWIPYCIHSCGSP